MTTLKAAFKIKLTLEDERYKSGSENFNIPLHSEVPPRYTMSQVMRTSLSIQQLHTAQVSDSHITNL